MKSRGSVTARLRSMAAGLVMSALPAASEAQEPAVVQGTVTDASSGAPIVDARISITGTTLQAVTDERGQYRLRGIRPGPVTIQVRRIGYRTAELRVVLGPGQIHTGDVSLVTSVMLLDEVVVTGTAGEMKRRAQAATVTDINVADLAQVAPINSLHQVLQSRTTGVSVLQTSGSSGTSAQIRVRGASSIALSNEPLVYVDGVRIATGLGRVWFTGGQSYDRLHNIDPDDIESIEIVKGPAAATLYGADASTGVIQILTRSGRVGATRFSQTATLEYNTIHRNFEPRTNYGRCTAAHVANSNNLLCFGQEVGTLVSDNPLLREGAFRTGRTLRLGWSGRGGGTNYGYYTSLKHESEDGVLPNNAFERSNNRVNFRWFPVPSLALDAGIGLSRTRTDLPDNDNNALGWLGNAQLGLPTTRTVDGTGANGWFGTQRDVAALSAIENQRQAHRTLGTLSATWTPLPWFTHRFIAGADWLREEDRRFIPRNDRGSYAINVGVVGESRRGIERYTLDYLGNVQRDLSDRIVAHLSLGMQLIETRDEVVAAQGEGLTVNTNNVVSAASSRTSFQEWSLQRNIGFMGQLQVGLNDRLYAQFGVRFDNASSFGQHAGWVTLPKVGVSWVTSEEPFWKIGLLNTLRLRAAWGSTGRIPAPGAALTTLTPAPYLDGAVVQPGAIPANPGNAELRFERGEELEAGFDAGLFGDRLGVDVTHFRKITRDLILWRPLPPSLGFTQNPFVNIGRVLNRGWEIGLTAAPINTRTFSWDLRVGASTLHNEITDMGDIEPFGTLNRAETGMQVGAWVTNRILHIDEESGVVTVTEDREFAGNVLPTFEGNLSMAFTVFRNFRIYGMLDTKRGHRVYNNSDWFRETQVIRSDNRLDPERLSTEERLRRYGNPAPGQPAFVTESGAPRTVNDVREAYIQKGDFVRLRELSVSLALPRGIARVFRAHGATIFLAGQNLGLWTEYEGFDPEVSFASLDQFTRNDFFTQPPPRRWIARFSLTF